MEVKHLIEGEWLTAETERAGPINLKIQYISYHEAILFKKLKNNEAALKEIEDLILDWDLTSDGKKLKCDKENKVKYVPYLIFLTLKVENGKPQQTLGQAIMQFAINPDSFTKN